MIEIHCQESDVIHAVEMAKEVVEFQAVEHPGSVIETEDVIAEQVAVTINDSSVRHPSVEQRLTPSEKLVGETLDFLCDGCVQHRAAKAPNLPEAVVPP